MFTWISDEPLAALIVAIGAVVLTDQPRAASATDLAA